MILAAGVWCCRCVALNVLSRTCIILCERLRLPAHYTSVAGLTASVECTHGLYGALLAAGVWCYIVALDVLSVSA